VSVSWPCRLIQTQRHQSPSSSGGALRGARAGAVSGMMSCLVMSCLGESGMGRRRLSGLLAMISLLRSRAKFYIV
jgi:hypothetical protein